MRERVFFEYDDADGENVDLSDAFLLARTKRGLECDEKVNALETGDAPHESPTDVMTEANDVKTPVQSKKTDYAKETNGAKKRMRRFNWLTITGAFLILLAAAIAWTPVGKIIPRQYSQRNIAVVDQSTATNVVAIKWPTELRPKLKDDFLRLKDEFDLDETFLPAWLK